MQLSKKQNLPSPGQFMTFQINNEMFGMPISDVREINQYGEITSVPHTSDSVKGVMNLRGKIIPVINLRVRFGLEEKPLTRDSCIIVIETPTGQVGMIVDSVNEVIGLKADQIEHSPELGIEEANAFVCGMGKVDKNVIILIDVNLAFSQIQMPDTSALSAA